MTGLASKSTTTWFLATLGNAAYFIKFHFEVVNIAQLTYTTSSNNNAALTWYINTAYIIQASNSASVC
jgi:hypothetical protein